jgi:aminoglycoside phosphotransferase (APT) family kinase protein
MKTTIEIAIDAIKREIPDKITGYEQIFAGFSNDKKIKLFSDNQIFLLRISTIESAKRRESEFEIMKKALSSGVKCNIPIKFGILADLEICYSLFLYIHGIEAENGLKKIQLHDAFLIGVDAGIDLRKLHTIKPDVEIKPWKQRLIEKHNKYRDKYEKCKYSFAEDSFLFNFIEHRIDDLPDTENNFQHDDFHVGNIIINDNKYAGVIDFNRMGWGDFAHDFVKMGWFSRNISTDFVNGQLDGYFCGQIPEQFWNSYSLYMAISIFSTIVWHLEYFPDLIKNCENHVVMILDDHDNFRNSIPKWKKTVSHLQ